MADAFDAEKLNVILGHSPLPSASDTDETAKEQKRSDPGEHLALLNRKYGIREEDLMFRRTAGRARRPCALRRP